MVHPFTVFISRVEANNRLARPNKRYQGKRQFQYVRERGDATGCSETAPAEAIGDPQQFSRVGIGPADSYRFSKAF